MKKVVITLPGFIDGEASRIVEMLNADTDYVHIRKPKKPADEVAKLITDIPKEYHHRLTLHDNFELLERFPNIGGVHLNSRNPTCNNAGDRRLSRSCHSLEEVKNSKENFDYVFLSPIFDSISKAGYNSAFSNEVLLKAKENGIIDNKVFALGGVTEEKLPLLKCYGFGGYAMLGAAWK